MGNQTRSNKHIKTIVGSIAIFGIMFTVGAMASHNFMPVKDGNAASVSGGVKLETEVVDSLAMRITSNSDDGIGFLGVDPSGTESIDPSTGEAESEISGPSLAYAELNANSTDFTTLYSNIEVRSNTGKFRLTMQDADTDTALGDSTAGEYHYIPSLTTAGTLSPTTASWGYLVGTYDSTTNSTWSPIPSSTDASAIILDPGLNAVGSYSNSTRISYGVATGATATGTYSDTLTYTATSIDSTPYTLTIANSNTTTSTDTLNLGYGDSTTITVTPTEGYYLSAYTCPTGYTCTLSDGDPIDTSTNATGTQTIKITNNNSLTGGTISFAGTKSTPTTMQAFTSSYCSSMSTNSAITLTDTRDNSSYVVKKLADNKCWMVQNLALTAESLVAAGHSTTLKTSDNDSAVTGNFTLSANNTGTWCTTDSSACDDQSMIINTGDTYGVLYNWYAATAGTGTYSTSSGNASGSICPKNWHLPTGGTTSAASEFVALDIAWGGTGQNRTGANTYSTFTGTYTSGNNAGFSLSGYRNGGSTNYQGASGFYWSSTALSATNAYNLRLYSLNTYVYPQDYNIKYAGFSVRCVAD